MNIAKKLIRIVVPNVFVKKASNFQYTTKYINKSLEVLKFKPKYCFSTFPQPYSVFSK